MGDAPRHLHLDALGGIAGDMFVAAALDAAPGHLDEARALAEAACPGLAMELLDAKDKGLTGKRLSLTLPDATRGPRHYPDYVALLRSAPTDDAVRDRACDILRRLGEAEAKIHGIALERVHFHELSDWDSIADVLLSALLIERLGIASGSAGDLPLGSGRVQTEHGPLPVPAPATLELLRGARLFDDGVAGERITPTGAAIFAHLAPGGFPSGGQVLDATGYGFGTRDLGSIANVLRLSVYDQTDGVMLDSVGVITFHIDDQTPEDLAVALDNIRADNAVLDVQQVSSLGKKNRLSSRIEVLCQRGAVERVSDLCFAETTTIGLRVHVETRRLLPREALVRETGRGPVRVKSVGRPGGEVTEKPEMDDIARAGDRAQRDNLRVQANRKARDHD